MKKFHTRAFCQLARQRLPQRTPEVVPVLNATISSTVSSSDDSNKLKFGIPLKEDLKAGVISNTIRTQWSNVPMQVRSLMEQSQSTSSFGSVSDSLVVDTSFSARGNSLLALIGKGPADLQLHRKEYCEDLSLVPFRRGMKSAYHWSHGLIPRSVAARCRGDLRVDPVNADRSILLLDQFMGKTSIVLCFSGNEFSGLNTGVKAWKNALGDLNVQTFHIHFCKGWLSRRTHPLTRQILKSFEDENGQKNDTMYIYRGKWARDLVLDFHLYNQSLPSILLVDKKGYVRWHAVGLPTEECVSTLRPLISRLAKETL